MRKLFVKIILLFFCFPSYGQEMWGIANSNYAGIMGLELNPASFMTSPYRTEIHIISGDIMIQNDYLYLPKGQSPVVNLVTLKGLTHDNLRDRFTSPSKNFYGNLFFKFPSYAWRNDRRAWNVHISLRALVFARGVAYHLAKFFWEGSDYVPLQQTEFSTPAYKAANITVGEIGATYSRILFSNAKNYLTGGITINFLDGMTGLFVDNKKMDYIIPQSSLLVVHSLTAEYGHALPANGKYSFTSLISPKGIGASTSIGFQFVSGFNPWADKSKTISRYEAKRYDYKAGISLLDLGAVYFTKNSKTFKFNGNSTYWPGFDTTKFASVDNFDASMSTRFYGEANQSLNKKKFTMIMPAAISAQFDVPLTSRIYVNASAIQPLYYFFPAVRRPAQAALTFRYEKRKFEVSAPFSLYEYSKLRFGLGFRFGILVIGSDHVLPYAGLVDSDGIDFYFGLKWSPGSGDITGKKKKQHCPAYK